MILPTKLKNGKSPYSYQKDAAREILHKRSAILAFDVGLGKTITSFLVMDKYRELTGGRIIVLVPPTLIPQWTKELDECEIDALVLSSGKIPTAADLGEGRFYFIMDEAHQYQNRSSKRTQAAWRLAAAADGVLPMTATPIRNYPSNFFPLLKMVRHPLGENYAAFERAYCGGKISGNSNLLELHDKVSNKVIVGEKSMLNLPPLKRILRNVKFVGAQKIFFDKKFTELREQYRQRLASGEISGLGWHMVMIGHLRQASAMAKSLYAAQLAVKAINEGHQVLLFTNFFHSAMWLADRLETAALTGKTPRGARPKLIDAFQNEEEEAFVITSAGGAGINLQQGTVFISVGRTWSPFDTIQQEGRIHRNGQTKPCWSIWLQDTVIDEFIDRKILTKYSNCRKIIYGLADKIEGVGNPGQWAEDLSNFLWGYK